MSENPTLLSPHDPIDRTTRSCGSGQMEGPHLQENTNGRVMLRHRGGFGRRDRHTHNGIVFSRPKSEYISPAGISALDIRTRLRITEAELAIVQRELSDLLAERNILEASSRQYEESWRFAVSEFGRIVEQRDELQKKYESLEQAIADVRQSTPEMKGKKNNKSKANFDYMKLSLETQTRVAESLEQERDRAYDDYEMTQVQLHTLFQQYQDLASSCSEVARDRDKLKSEVQLLREELHSRSDPDSEITSSRSSLRKTDSNTGSGGSLASVGGSSRVDSDENLSTEPQVLIQQLREARDDRDRINSKYEQLMKKADQFQKQLYRAEDDRRQALATSEALTSLWQKKFDKAQNENYDLRQELLSAHERISLLQDHLAMARLQSRGSTPLRPSPPDGENPVDNLGRLSPVKAPSGSTNSSFWGSKLNSSGSSVVSNESLLGSGGSRVASENPPQRTSSFHGYNQVHHYSLSQTTSYGSSHITTLPSKQSSNGHSISRTSSLKIPQEFISPYNSQSTLRPPSNKYLFSETLEGDHHNNDDEDDDGSWI